MFWRSGGDAIERSGKFTESEVSTVGKQGLAWGRLHLYFVPSLVESLLVYLAGIEWLSPDRCPSVVKGFV